MDSMGNGSAGQGTLLGIEVFFLWSKSASNYTAVVFKWVKWFEVPVSGVSRVTHAHLEGGQGGKLKKKNQRCISAMENQYMQFLTS